MEFDPDAYLAGTKAPSVAFDPDAYLASSQSSPSKQGKSLVEQIPGMDYPQAVPQAQEGMWDGFKRGLKEIPRTILDVPAALATGLVSQPVGAAYGVARNIFSGGYGTAEGANKASSRAAELAAKLTYEPRTESGKQIVSGVNEALGAVAPAFPSMLGGEFKALGAKALPKPDTKAMAREISSGNNARNLDAIKISRDMGLKLNPSAVDSSITNRVGSSLVGDTAFNESAARINRETVNSLGRKEAGIAEGTPLGKDAYDAAASNAAKVYDEVRAVQKFTTDKQFRNNLDSQSFITSLPEAEQMLLKKSGAVNSLIEQANLPEFTGTGAVAIMRQLRADSNKVMNNPNAMPADIALAHAQRNVAKQIESMVDRNLNDKGMGDLSRRFKEGRTQIAKIKTLEKITDEAGNLDITKLKLDKNNSSYTGILKDLKDVGAVFSGDFSKPSVKGQNLNISAGGRINALLDLLSTPVRKGMLSETYQNWNAKNIDFRSARDKLGYAEPKLTVAPKQGLELAESWEPSPFKKENGTPTQAGNQFTIGEPPPQQPGGQLQMASVDYPGYPPPAKPDLVTRINTQLDAAQAARELAERKPTGRGTPYDLDPITGRLRSVSEGMRGATPDSIISTGHELNSAVEKLQSGRQFSMSATDKIAWDKAKVDLATIDPRMRTLSDSQIRAKMMDRKDVSDLIQKAREKEAGFAAIALRETEVGKIRAATIEREKMAAFAEMLGEKLSGKTIIKPSSQGPKTRAAILADRVRETSP